MKNIIENFAKLIKVKTIVTLAVIGVFVYMACIGRVTSDNVMTIVTMVVSFYFGTVSEQNKEGNK